MTTVNHLKIWAAAVAAMLAMAVSALPISAQEISQEVEQEAESGDVDQSFTVTGGGDNSNQTVGFQGVVNTGNAQSALGLIQFDDDFDFDDGDFEFDDAGADIDVSPELSISSDQNVNQTAVASK